MKIISTGAKSQQEMETEWCEKYWHDMKSSMSWFIFNKDEWKIVEVRW